MVKYADLRQRLEDGEVIILDGAIGSELQRMGVPMHHDGWAANATETHPDSVRQLHEDYVRAGVDVITTNTYTAARHVLQEGEGAYADRTADWNTRAAELALEARDRISADRPVYVAGSVSLLGDPPAYAPANIRESCEEQVSLLKEAGVDFLLLEMLETSIERTRMAIEIAARSGLPFWTSLTCMIDDDGPEVLYGCREAPSQRVMPVDDTTFADAVERIRADEGSDAVLVFHSEVESTGPALEAMKSGWNGITGAYANSGYWVRPNWQYVEMTAPARYLEKAREWVGMGAQIIGGCCGVGLQHVELLRDGLPTTI